MNDIMRIIKEENITVLDQQFDNDCLLRFSARKIQVNTVVGRLQKVEGARLHYIKTI